MNFLLLERKKTARNPSIYRRSEPFLGFKWIFHPMEATGLEPVTKNRIGSEIIGSAGYLDKNLDKKSVQFAGYDVAESIV